MNPAAALSRWRSQFSRTLLLLGWPVLGFLPPGQAADLAPGGNSTLLLTNLAAVRGLSVEQAQANPLADVTGVVTWLSFSDRGCFLDDGVTAVWVDSELPNGLPPGTRLGSRLRVIGPAHAGFFTPSLSATNLQLLGQALLPPARPAGGWDLRVGKWDGLRVVVTGTVFETRNSTGLPELRLLSEGVGIALTGPTESPPFAFRLPGRATVTGISSLGIIERQPVDCGLLLSAWDQVVLAAEPPQPPPLVPLAGLLQLTNSAWLDRAVALRGVVTWRDRRRFAVQDATGGILVRLTNGPLPAVGSLVAVTGGVSRSPQRVDFVAMAVENLGATNLPAPLRLQPDSDFRNPEFRQRRVTVAGRLIYRHWTDRREEWLLFRPDPPEHFRAAFTPERSAGLLDGIKVDSTVEITGTLQRDFDQGDQGAEALILVANDGDVRWLSPPPLSRRSSLALIGTTSLTLLGSLLGTAWWWHSGRLTRLRQTQLETENRLRERFALIAETASDQIVTLDFSGRITFINPVGNRLLAHRGDSLLGQPYVRWIAPEQRALWVKQVAEAAEGLAVRPFEVEIERADQTRMEVEMVLRRLNEREIQCIGRDLTEARSVQRELARQEHQLRTIVDSMAEGIIVLDAHQVVVSLNPVAERILGVPRSAVLGRPLAPDWQCLWPDGSQVLPEQHPLSRTLRNGEPVDACQFSFLSGDGQRRWLSVNTRALAREATGQVQQVIATFSDITEGWNAEQQRRQLEEKLRRSETLRALGTLAGGVAHDFNNLLTSILGNAELSLLDLPAGHPAVQNAREISAAARRGADLVRRILSFSRPQSPERVPLLLSAVVEEAARVAAKVMPPGVRFHWWTEPGELPIRGDPTQLNQVLVNLCTNAAHALEEKGGELEVLIRPAELGAEAAAGTPPLKPGPAVRLTVRDTGCGMDAGTRARIFEPFFTTKEPGHGTGLGLAIVHNVVQAHEGRITVESQPGLGTRIDILFPAFTEVPPAPAAHGETGEQPRGRGEELLVVDDDPAVLRFTQRALQGLGYQVTAVDSPTLALGRLRGELDRFQLLLTDLSMPEQSGADLALAARALRPDLPVIIATGYGPTAHQQLARTGNQFPVLAKPFSLLELARAIRSELDRGQGS